MCKISIIIPVFNLENYLSKCINSVLAQSYKNFEVIIVDDGSTDNSAKIIDSYAEKDNRIIPVHIKNGGVSNARNIALDKAIGKYVYFLDGDDYIEADTLEILKNNIEGFDLVQASYDRVYKNGNVDRCISDDKILENKDAVLGSYFLKKITDSSWNKLFIKENIGTLRFDVNLKVAEDALFVYEYIKTVKRIKLISNVTYHYYIHEGSCMNSKLSEKHFFPIELCDMLLPECKGNKTLYKKWVTLESNLCCSLIYSIVSSNCEQYYYKLKDLRKRIVTKKRYIFFSGYYSFKFKIRALILWLFPGLLYRFYSK